MTSCRLSRANCTIALTLVAEREEPGAEEEPGVDAIAIKEDPGGENSAIAIGEEPRGAAIGAAANAGAADEAEEELGAEKAIAIGEELGAELGVEKAIGIKEEPGENNAITIGEEPRGATNKETATGKETTDEAEAELRAELGAEKAIAIEEEPGGENNGIGIRKKPGEAEEKPTAHEEPGAVTVRYM